MEELPARPLVAAGARRRSGAIARESWAHGRRPSPAARPAGTRSAPRASRARRSAGKDGGVYYVLAPGPSLLLAPALRLDRAINRARGEPGRVAVSVLAVVRARRAARDGALPAGAGRDRAAGPRRRPRLRLRARAARSSSTSSSSTRRWWGRWCWPWPSGRSRSGRSALRRHPWLFGLAARRRCPGCTRSSCRCGWRWWRRRCGSAGRSGPRRRGRGARRRACSCRTAASLYLTALYNFAITGSVRPDALFLAWGPGGVTSARVGQGVLGLLLDARYGILPYVPILLLAAGRARSSAARGASPS